MRSSLASADAELAELGAEKARYEALRSIRETEPEAHATQMATTLEDEHRRNWIP